jgi:hypothetical protein
MAILSENDILCTNIRCNSLIVHCFNLSLSHASYLITTAIGNALYYAMDRLYKPEEENIGRVEPVPEYNSSLAAKQPW